MNNLLSSSILFVKRNSATILTCVGAAGVVATSVMAATATPKALRSIEAAKEEKGEKLTRLETIAVVAPAYAPTVVTGIATIGCIFGANVLNKRHQATLMSAYALLDSSYKDYKKKVEELFGEDANKQVRAEIAKDRYDKSMRPTSDDKQLFYDFFSGQYFESTMEAVLEAEYDLNRSLIIDGGVYLNDFYRKIGAEPIESGDLYGWSVMLCEESYWQAWVDFDHEIVEIDDDSENYGTAECCVITMVQEPMLNFVEYW